MYKSIMSIDMIIHKIHRTYGQRYSVYFCIYITMKFCCVFCICMYIYKHAVIYLIIKKCLNWKNNLQKSVIQEVLYKRKNFVREIICSKLILKLSSMSVMLQNNKLLSLTMTICNIFIVIIVTV